MFGIINYKLFVLSGILLNLTPGADTIYILGKGMSQGKKSAIVSALGISIGCLVHTVLAAFGLSVILEKSIFAFNLIKWIGATYLIYLGIKSYRANGLIVENSKNEQIYNSRKNFFQGVLTNVLNPKVALFFLSFLPQFISVNNNYGTLPFLLLGFTFVFTGTIWSLFLAVCSTLMTKNMKNNPKMSKILNKIAGIVFVGLGIKLFRAKN